MTKAERIDRATLGDDVAERLRRAILLGEIEPGERLRIQEIQDAYGVSHIPVREALRVLEGEGLVENMPQRGAIAAPLSVEMLREVYDARRLLEPVILTRAVSALSAEQKASVRKAHEGMTQAESSGDRERFFDAHRTFHWELLRAGATPTLERIVKQLWSASDRYVRVSKVAYPGDVDVARGQHKALLDRALESDMHDAAAVLLEHLHVTESAVLAHADNHVVPDS